MFIKIFSCMVYFLCDTLNKCLSKYFHAWFIFYFFFFNLVYIGSFTFFPSTEGKLWKRNSQEFQLKKLVYPLHPNISRHILHAVLYTFPKVLTRRICLTIISFYHWWSFPLFSWPLCVTWGWYYKEKFDASHS